LQLFSPENTNRYPISQFGDNSHPGPPFATCDSVEAVWRRAASISLRTNQDPADE